MSEPLVSVHILALETTNLGKLFFQSCLECLSAPKYPHQLIIVDNGCSNDVKDMYWSKSDDFEKFTVIDNDKEKDFSKLRNLALESTASECTHMHWIDTDECYRYNSLQSIKTLMSEYPSAEVIYTWFWHFMIDPTKYQLKQYKDNIFSLKNRERLKWINSVHERIVGYDHTKAIKGDYDYLHFGYIRPQWIQAIKWIKYDILAHGHADGYRECFDDNHNKVIDYYGEERGTPDQCLEDRVPHCTSYDGSYPESFHRLILNPWIESGKPWKEFLQVIDDEKIWTEWQEQCKLLGSWKNTIGWICEKIGMPEIRGDN